MESTETSNPESAIEDLENDNTIVKFVALVFYQATRNGATEIIFTAEDSTEPDFKPTRELSAVRADLDTLLATAIDFENEESDQSVGNWAARFSALWTEMDVFDAIADKERPDVLRLFPQRGMKLSIHYRAGEKLHAPSQRPGYLFSPVICRLCVMAGIDYWAKGCVEGFSHLTIQSRSVLWRAHSDNLRKSITLTHATAAQAEEYARRKPIEIPPLPAPLPDEPLLPECLCRPTAPRNRTEAIVWFGARMVFYPVTFFSLAFIFTGLPFFWLLRQWAFLWQPGDIMWMTPNDDILSRICFSLLLGIATAIFIHLFSRKRSSTK